MTTQEVANRYYEMTIQNKRMDIQAELYGESVVSKEPEHAAAMGVPTLTEGKEAVKAKGVARRAMIETIHNEYCSEPLVGANFFSVSMGRDITFKGKPRMQLEEIAVFEVKDSKIVLEQFFY